MTKYYIGWKSLGRRDEALHGVRVSAVRRDEVLHGVKVSGSA